MSLLKQHEKHERMHNFYSCEAVRAIQQGASQWRVEWSLEQAAMERHLAYEYLNTWQIAQDAKTEYLQRRRAELAGQ